MLLPDTHIVSDAPEQKTADRVGITFTKNIRRYGSVRLNDQLVILYTFVKYGYLALSGPGSV